MNAAEAIKEIKCKISIPLVVEFILTIGLLYNQ